MLMKTSSLIALLLFTSSAFAGGESGKQKSSQTKSPGKAISESLSMPVGDCTYSASVRGHLKNIKGQAQSSQAQGQNGQRVDPDINVSAVLECPTKTAVRVTDNIMKSGPLSQQQLELALERRATIAVERPGGMTCVYLPDFDMRNDGVSVEAVTELCPIASAPVDASETGGAGLEENESSGSSDSQQDHSGKKQDKDSGQN